MVPNILIQNILTIYKPPEMSTSEEQHHVLDAIVEPCPVSDDPFADPIADSAVQLVVEKLKVYNEFSTVIQKMIDNNYPLPDDFELYYTVLNHSDRQGRVIHISSHLTEKSANDSCEDDYDRGHGKWWSSGKYSVISSRDMVELEKYVTSHGRRKCSADMGLLL